MLLGVRDFEAPLNPLQQCHVLLLYLRLQPSQRHKHHARWQGHITLVRLDNWIANSFLQRLQLSKCVGTTLALVSATWKRIATPWAIPIVESEP